MHYPNAVTTVTMVTLLACVAPVASQGLPWLATTERVSVSSDEVQGDGSSYISHYSTDVSADGRFVAFTSASTNLVADDTNDVFDVFVRDLQAGTTERVSIATSGKQGNGAALGVAISATGRFVAFSSTADTLGGGLPGVRKVFVRDRESGETMFVAPYASTIGISADGRYVCYQGSDADIFVHDLDDGSAERANLTWDGGEPSTVCRFPSLSGDGRCVAFGTQAINMVPGDTNGEHDIFIRDLDVGETQRVSVGLDGAESNGDSYYPFLSFDGRYVVFSSTADNLVPADTTEGPNLFDVFVRDCLQQVTTRASVASDGAEQIGTAVDGLHGSLPLDISADGRFVAFASTASNLVPGDTNTSQFGWAADIFVRDLDAKTTVRVSLGSQMQQADGHCWFPRISDDGSTIVFHSDAANLVRRDTNGVFDVFVHRRVGGRDR